MLIKCGYCKGSGHKYSNSDTLCPVCNGVGQVDVPGNHTTCGYCKGNGHKYSNSDTICPACNGTGVGKAMVFE